MALDEETFVVVEDDDYMRQLLIDTLESNGASAGKIRSFTNGAEAQAYFQNEACQEAIVICDIAMPTVSGLELYKRIGSEMPGLKFVFVSALDLMLSEQLLLREAGLPVLAKPFDEAELMETIRQISDRE